MSSTRQKRWPSPLNEYALRQLTRTALDKGYYRESFHAESGHPERNISIDDVLHGLERSDWVYKKPPDFDEAHQSWEYLVRTIDIEGEELIVKIAAYPQEKRFDIITRW